MIVTAKHTVLQTLNIVFLLHRLVLTAQVWRSRRWDGRLAAGDKASLLCSSNRVSIPILRKQKSKRRPLGAPLLFWRRGWDGLRSPRGDLRAAPIHAARECPKRCRVLSNQWVLIHHPVRKLKKGPMGPFSISGGEGGIRTHGTGEPYT